MHLRAMVATPDGKRIASAEVAAPPDAEALGAQVAELLRAQDAEDILSSCLSEAAQPKPTPARPRWLAMPLRQSLPRPPLAPHPASRSSDLGMTGAVVITRPAAQAAPLAVRIAALGRVVESAAAGNRRCPTSRPCWPHWPSCTSTRWSPSSRPTPSTPLSHTSRTGRLA
jgi:hypothetical protein